MKNMIKNNVEKIKTSEELYITCYNINKSTNKKIISFSLYNDKDIFNYGLLVNYELKKKIFKDQMEFLWT